MGKRISISQQENRLRNIRGTFAAEGMTLSQSTRNNLDRIEKGQASYEQILSELREKYKQKG